MGYIKTRQEMLEEIEREWERPKVFDRQIEEAQDVEEGPSNIEKKAQTNRNYRVCNSSIRRYPRQ